MNWGENLTSPLIRPMCPPFYLETWCGNRRCQTVTKKCSKPFSLPFAVDPTCLQRHQKQKPLPSNLLKNKNRHKVQKTLHVICRSSWWGVQLRISKGQIVSVQSVRCIGSWWWNGCDWQLVPGIGWNIADNAARWGYKEHVLRDGRVLGVDERAIDGHRTTTTTSRMMTTQLR